LGSGADSVVTGKSDTIGLDGVLEENSSISGFRPLVTQNISAPRSSSSTSWLQRIKIPNYELLEELGRGGMGVVYKARNVALKRDCAIKMILSAEHASDEVRRRFEAEAQAVARLVHPNIVQVYEVGETEGRPYFVLEYVSGGTLSGRLKGKTLAPRQAATMMEIITRAIAFAHAEMIIHRDIKPQNILMEKQSIDRASSSSTIVTSGPTFCVIENDILVPKITDFGLAKQIEADGSQTQNGAILGTPEYMAPEQASGRITDIGPATDVYALGAMLYEVLTGRVPLLGDSPMATIMKVLRDDPVPPSKVAPENRIPRDLELVCMKCLEKAPAKRYRNANDLADDLRRFIDGDPISVRAATSPEKVRRWVRKNPVAAGFSLVFAVGLAAILSVVLVKNGELHEREARARKSAELAETREAEAKRRSIRLMVSNGISLLDRGDTLRSLPYFAEALALDSGDAARSEMHRIRVKSALRTSPRLVHGWFHEHRVTDSEFSPDGERIGVSCEDGRLLIYSVHDLGKAVPPIVLIHTSAVTRFAFDPTGQRILSVCADGIVQIWDWKKSTVKSEATYRHTHAVTVARFSKDPEGARFLTGSKDRTVVIHDTASGKPLKTLHHASAVIDAEFDNTGERVATSAEDGTARIWTIRAAIRAGEESLPSAEIGSTEEEAALTMPHRSPISRVCFSPDGKKLLTASFDQTAMIWDSETGRPITRKPIRRSAPILDAAYNPNGRDIALVTKDGTGRVWNGELDDWRTWVVRHDGAINKVAFSPDGRSMATASEDNTAQVWEINKGEPITPPLRHNGSVTTIEFSIDGSMLLTSSRDGVVRLWDISSRSALGSQIPSRDARREIYSPDRRHLVRISSTDPTTAKVYDAGTGVAVSGILRHDGEIRQAGFARDGQKVLTAGSDHVAKVWGLDGTLLGLPLRHGSDVLCATFGPQGNRVATGSEDNTARVWDWEKGEPITPPLRHNGAVNRILFSPDGTCVLTSSDDGTSRVWDARTGEALTSPLRGAGWHEQAIVSGDTNDGWDLPTDPHAIEYLQHLAQWYSSHRIDGNGDLVPLTGIELKGVWERLQADPGTDFHDIRNELARLNPVWHRREAENAERAGESFAAEFHLSILLRSSRTALSDTKSQSQAALSDHAGLLDRRGAIRAERTDWSGASRDFAEASVLRPDDTGLLTSTALTQWKAGRVEEYRKTCAELFRLQGTSAYADTARTLVWTLMIEGLSPDPKGTMVVAPSKVVELARKASQGRVDAVTGSLAKIALGAALLREGKCAEAAAMVEDGQTTAEGYEQVRAYLTMCAIRTELAQHAEARKWLLRAERWKAFYLDARLKADVRVAVLPWRSRLEMDVLIEAAKARLSMPASLPMDDKVGGH